GVYGINLDGTGYVVPNTNPPQVVANTDTCLNVFDQTAISFCATAANTQYGIRFGACDSNHFAFLQFLGFPGGVKNSELFYDYGNGWTTDWPAGNTIAKVDLATAVKGIKTTLAAAAGPGATTISTVAS